MTSARLKKTATGHGKKAGSCAKIINVTPPHGAGDAIAIQNELREQVILENQFDEIKILAGVDVSYDIKADLTHAYIVLFDAYNREMIASARAVTPTIFPYIPGLLSFREIPALLEAFSCLPVQPDLLMVDGQGIAHPRRFGIASHLGVLLDLPAIGVAKKRLCGKHDEIGPHKGDHIPLIHKGEAIGTVLRSKEKCNPLFISAGHRIDQATALTITQDWITHYRLPEPTRIADKISKWPV